MSQVVLREDSGMKRESGCRYKWMSDLRWTRMRGHRTEDEQVADVNPPTEMWDWPKRASVESHDQTNVSMLLLKA